MKQASQARSKLFSSLERLRKLSTDRIGFGEKSDWAGVEKSFIAVLALPGPFLRSQSILAKNHIPGIR
jgi:hypothetical protein